MLVRELERREGVARVARGRRGDRGEHLAARRRVAERGRAALEHAQERVLASGS